MAEMGRISRFFVNTFSARRNVRILGFLGRNLSLPDGTECFEVGCGNADLAARFVEAFRPARYVATDLDPHQLEAAERQLAKRYPNGVPAALELRSADMLHLPFPDGSFHAAIAITAIHHAGANHHDPAPVPAALSEVDRVLRPGGSLVYEEILHKGLIRTWLADHGYAIVANERGLKRESVVARKGS